MVYKKSPDEIAAMRRGGRVLVEVMNRLEPMVRQGTTTLELDVFANDYIQEAGARSSAKGQGFPGAICISPNDVVVHGVPGPYRLEHGDVVTLDVALFYEGFHVDTAWTYPVGTIDNKARDLLSSTERALHAAISMCQPGKRLGDVGWAAQQTVEAAGFSVVSRLGGHGIGRKLWEPPTVLNVGPPDRREMLRPGMTIAVEPITAAGGSQIELLADGWTVVTADGSLAAHFEHTVAITPDGCEVLTHDPHRSAAAA
ncbi:MAG: type I methionyl aminopeptidase [Actinobacteria bacterium]|nr:type I methionyl aminopeptidase [Actinomycetota bacterium]